MKHKIIDPTTNKEIEIEFHQESIVNIENAFQPKIENQKIANWIDNMPTNGEIKALIHKLKEFAIKISDKVVKVGYKIIEIIINFVKLYPNTAIGVIIGAVLSLIISTIPLLGILLLPIVKPLLLALGIAMGYWQDFKEKKIKSELSNEMADRINEAVTYMSLSDNFQKQVVNSGWRLIHPAIFRFK